MHLLCWMTSVSNCVGLRPRWCFWKKWPRLLTILLYLQRMGTFCQSQLRVLRQGPGRFLTTLTVLKRSWNQVAFLKSHRCFKRLLCRLPLRLRLCHYRRNILSILESLATTLLIWYFVLMTIPLQSHRSVMRLMFSMREGHVLHHRRIQCPSAWLRFLRENLEIDIAVCARSPLQISQRFERQWCTTTTIEIRVFLFVLVLFCFLQN